MSKTPKRPKAKKISRNPVARDLATTKYRARVLPKPGAYKRRPKHPAPAEEPE